MSLIKAQGAGDASTGFYSHTIDQSLRFEDGDSAYLTRTFGSASNQRTWTWSAWIKRGNLGGSVIRLFNANDGGSPFRQTSLRFDSDQLRFYNDAPSGTATDVKSSAVFRDPSAWYNIVLAIDTTSGTASNRVKMYVNGSQITDLATSTYPTQNLDMYVNAARSHQIGASVTPSQHFDGYMAEVNFIDGSQLDPSSFGETKAGIWIPKDTSDLTFGTNGFRLKFQDSSALGDDTSGNGNDFTASGHASTDVMLDSPTNNFANFNGVSGPNFYGTAGTYSQGNLHMRANNSVSSYIGADSTIGVSSGKWYWEIRAGSNGSSFYPGIGIRSPSGGDSHIHYRTQTQAYIDGSPSGQTLSTYTSGDIIGVALDLDSSTNTLQYYKNGSANGTTFSLTSGHEWLSVTGNRYYSSTSGNFGADSSFFGQETAQGNADDNGNGDFYYSPPTGFLALCTDNLPNPGIDPAQDEEPVDYFNTVLYTGNGTSASDTQAISGVGFSPDFTWIKNRTDAAYHALNDRVRGAGKNLFSNDTTVENGAGASTGDLFTSFDSDGFTVNFQYASSTNNGTNQNAKAYVAWNWLAGGSASSNEEGSITSSVSANTEAGFSIVTYTGTGSNATVGHGLSSAPDWIVVKNRTFATNWTVYHSANTSSPATQYLSLNLTDATNSGSGVVWQSTAPTSSVFSIGTGNAVNRSTDTFVAYCFSEIPGYSKFGSYTGNGASDGRFIYTGFRPAFIIYKETGNSNNWIMLDNKRDPDNVVGGFLYPNLNAAEATGYTILDFCSNGFKHRSTANSGNRSGGSYIYIAFAEQPFKFANAR